MRENNWDVPAPSLPTFLRFNTMVRPPANMTYGKLRLVLSFHHQYSDKEQESDSCITKIDVAGEIQPMIILSLTCFADQSFADSRPSLLKNTMAAKFFGAARKRLEGTLSDDSSKTCNLAGQCTNEDNLVDVEVIADGSTSQYTPSAP